MNNQTKLTRREREKLSHKREIQEAALKVFAEKGYHSATLEEISGVAEFSKGALYLYFENKEDLLFSLLDDGITEMHRIIEDNLNGSRSLREEIHEFINQFLMFLKKNKDFIRILSVQEGGAFFTLDQKTQKILCRRHVESMEYISQRFQKAIDSGEIHAIEPHLYAAIFHGLMLECFHSLFAETYKMLKPPSREDIYIMVDLIFDGLRKTRSK